ncbi:MAG: acyl-CoA dehydrogenase [Hyphomicrobium sp.]|nr:acyl-CoA dehydrogenase [Hyphomicrobium sp.]
MSYSAPVDDIVTALKTVADLDVRLANGLYPGLDADTVRAVLDEAGNFAADVLAPLNWSGDRVGARWQDGNVSTPPGFADAYRQFSAAGWSALPCSEEFGGQGLPEIISSSVGEIWNAANLAFGLCPLLTQGAIHAIEAGGSDALKQTYLPKMVSGQWTGTMNLTEPHAGSDLSGLKTRAEKQADGTYRITGTKIFITCGEHDMAENIIHLVLARLPDAPAGTRGISLFLVPKFLLTADGTPGARNDVVCAGIEHKLGIMASPTCIMKFGEQGGATGYLVGEENRGLANMFVMMNSARLAVGIQGVAIADRATQRAIAFAKERTQGRSSTSSGAGMAPIVEHPDIRRTLLTMKALTQASRMICLATAAALDNATYAADPEEAKAARNLAALLTPVAKSFATDVAVDVASLGIQVHGGMGFVEETGAAQHLRDARILPIYEGTNGIQAIDLVTRKLPLEGGNVVTDYLSGIGDCVTKLHASDNAGLGRTAKNLKDALDALSAATRFIGKSLASDPDAGLAGATPYLNAFARVAGARYLAEAALRDGASSSDIALARFFAENCLTAAVGLSDSAMNGSATVLASEGLLA